MNTTAFGRRRLVLIALALWTVFALAVVVYVAENPGRRTVTPTYRIAAAAWFEGGRLYNDPSDIGGFLYFPQAALLYVPFAGMPPALGETLWRLCGMALLATGLWRLTGLIDRGDRASLFLLFTAMCIPATISSARNGQMNLHLAGLMLHAAADTGSGAWWRASLSLVLGLALKPHAIVPVLLTAAVYPRTRRWLAIMIVAAAAVPFLLQRPSYVLAQYGACFERILFAVTPATDTWSDLRGLLVRLNIDVPNRWLLVVRLAAAIPTAALAYVARRHDTGWTAILVFALAATYLMIFNPRNEANTYVILAPAVAASASLAWRRQQRVAFWSLIVLAGVLGCENYGRTIFLATDLWLKPLLTIVFAAYLVSLICERRVAAGARVSVNAGSHAR
jgi:hypothetical protein